MARTKNSDSIGGGTSGNNNPPAPSWTPRPDTAVSSGSAGGGGEGSGGTGGGGGRTGQIIRNPVSSKAGGLDFRQVFTGATLKKIMGLPSVMSDVIFGKVKNDSGSVTVIAPDRSDVYIAFIDVLSGIPGIGRLFSPGSIFWRLPKSGDSITVLKHSDADGPGMPYILHGDGGAKNAVPSWLGANDAGVYANENLHFESGNNVVIKAASGAGSASGQDDSFTSNITLHGSNGSITIDGGISPDASFTINVNGGASFKINAGGGSISVDGLGNIVLNNGVLNVARLTDQVQGTAGPFPVSATITGPGALNVKA